MIYQISFVIYAYIAPDFNFNGEKIKTIDKNGMMHRFLVVVIPEDTQPYILFSCLASQETVFYEFFEQIRGSDFDKVFFYFDMISPLFSENLVISEKLWNKYDEKTQAGLMYMTNAKGHNQSVMSQGIGMGIRNAAADEHHDYSICSIFDLF